MRRAPKAAAGKDGSRIWGDRGGIAVRDSSTATTSGSWLIVTSVTPLAVVGRGDCLVDLAAARVAGGYTKRDTFSRRDIRDRDGEIAFAKRLGERWLPRRAPVRRRPSPNLGHPRL